MSLLKEKQFLIETDVIVDYLNHQGNKLDSKLIEFLSLGKCFTTVINASELYYSCKDDFQVEIVSKFLYSINVLGIHPRYSLLVKDYSKYFNNTRDCLFYLVALFNKLSLVTKRKNIFPSGEVEIILI
jgi:predicted nucleic acid-binding protein